jgi:hypothetical protein
MIAFFATAVMSALVAVSAGGPMTVEPPLAGPSIGEMTQLGVRNDFLGVRGEPQRTEKT